MAWSNEQRRSAELPRDWPTRRRQVEARAGGQCEQVQANGERCPNRGTECHHAGDRDDHRLESLQWLCRDCHEVETQWQAKVEKVLQQAKLVHRMQRRRYLVQKLGPRHAEVLGRAGLRG